MSTIVHTKYAFDDPPPHPGPGWTRFVCISDTHSKKFSIPRGDILLHAGDLSSWGYYEQLRTTVEWLKTLPHELKIIIAGNHDLCLDADWHGFGGSFKFTPEEIRDANALVRSESALDAGIRYLNKEWTTIKSNQGRAWKIYGSPATPEFLNGAFHYRNSAEGKEEWARIPADVDILMTHTPPSGVLDFAKCGANVGCPELGERLKGLSQCRLHVFGHIHEDHGVLVTKKIVEGKEFEFVSINAALMRGGKAVIVDLKDEIDDENTTDNVE